ncbi:MAG: hypothetical protein O8C67_11975 [Candidatus Methanoperedens sp.]|nr:hypothetical protein [Candidatus Methanoperedens sp.]
MKLKFDLKKITKKKVAVILIFIIEGAAAYGLWNIYTTPEIAVNDTSVANAPSRYVFKPSVSIGCSRVVWKDTEVHLSATTNLRTAKLEWSIDNKTVGTLRNLVYTFTPGKNTIIVKAVSDNDSLQDESLIIVVNSTDGILAEAVTGSMSNERVFMTKYNDATYYIDGVSVILDGKNMGTIPECRKMTVSGLGAGVHNWKATFHGKDIGSGSFNLETVTRVKITRIDIAGSYRAGDTVNARIYLLNTGTVPVKQFSIKTLAVNHKFEWMGDISKKEFTSNFDYELKQGASVEIPVLVTIPEKVSGVRPAGDYSITIQLIVNNNMQETQTVKTVVV